MAEVLLAQSLEPLRVDDMAAASLHVMNLDADIYRAHPPRGGHLVP